jgi:hypothetical protein
VRNHNIECETVRRMPFGQASIIVDRGSNSESADQTKTTSFPHRVKTKLRAGEKYAGNLAKSGRPGVRLGGVFQDADERPILNDNFPGDMQRQCRKTLHGEGNDGRNDFLFCKRPGTVLKKSLVTCGACRHSTVNREWNR